jgi:hypothetical protein
VQRVGIVRDAPGSTVKAIEFAVGDFAESVLQEFDRKGIEGRRLQSGNPLLDCSCVNTSRENFPDQARRQRAYSFKHTKQAGESPDLRPRYEKGF